MLSMCTYNLSLCIYVFFCAYPKCFFISVSLCSPLYLLYFNLLLFLSSISLPLALRQVKAHFRPVYASICMYSVLRPKPTLSCPPTHIEYANLCACGSFPAYRPPQPQPHQTKPNQNQTKPNQIKPYQTKPNHARKMDFVHAGEVPVELMMDDSDDEDGM